MENRFIRPPRTLSLFLEEPVIGHFLPAVWLRFLSDAGMSERGPHFSANVEIGKVQVKSLHHFPVLFYCPEALKSKVTQSGDSTRTEGKGEAEIAKTASLLAIDQWKGQVGGGYSPRTS